VAVESPFPESLKANWRQLTKASAWDVSAADAVCDELLALWSAPSRAYHNLLHLSECLVELSEEDPSAEAIDLRTVALAVWFHDAVYDARRHDNETTSADLAASRLQRLGESEHTISRVRRLILDTAHRTEPDSIDGRLIVDIDLSILGKNADRFDNYNRGIRSEYAHVPWADYRAGRLKVLRGFLERPVIYRTSRLRGRYEQTARSNLQRAIDGLTSAS